MRLPRPLFDWYCKGAVRGWGRCGTCGATAEYAGLINRPRLPLFPRVIRRCFACFDPDEMTRMARGGRHRA